jgi:hypothetical protein
MGLVHFPVGLGNNNQHAPKLPSSFYFDPNGMATTTTTNEQHHHNNSIHTEMISSLPRRTVSMTTMVVIPLLLVVLSSIVVVEATSTKDDSSLLCRGGAVFLDREDATYHVPFSFPCSDDDNNLHQQINKHINLLKGKVINQILIRGNGRSQLANWQRVNMC